jgi:hypothetical protein
MKIASASGILVAWIGGKTPCFWMRNTRLGMVPADATAKIRAKNPKQLHKNLLSLSMSYQSIVEFLLPANISEIP